MIHNHSTAKLSDLDMRMVKSIPEGGNWKDIPESIPSLRLEKIRASYARGEGSRSTYYGRLRRDQPSYTINTYFNRPGNGCHIHYNQDRVLSQREAARLQSFPDSFEFLGTQGAIHTQIGNAVPPLLAFQIAKTLGKPGYFVDLFSGAGGMALGFKWAGWEPIVANDIEPKFLATYARNIHDNTIVGSLAEKCVFELLIKKAMAGRNKNAPFWVLGGPPCQGFSTAGKKRTMEDPRNHLVWSYLKFLEKVNPDGFVFENVTGLLSMEKGRVFENIKTAFSDFMPSINGSVLSSDHYGIPQRRKRFILVGHKKSKSKLWAPPEVITRLTSNTELFDTYPHTISVEEAISDLPHLSHGDKITNQNYIKDPDNIYQAFMRGYLDPQNYVRIMKSGQRHWTEDYSQ